MSMRSAEVDGLWTWSMISWLPDGYVIGIHTFTHINRLFMQQDSSLREQPGSIMTNSSSHCSQCTTRKCLWHLTWNCASSRPAAGLAVGKQRQQLSATV
jgi:hypothetical protein